MPLSIPIADLLEKICESLSWGICNTDRGAKRGTPAPVGLWKKHSFFFGRCSLPGTGKSNLPCLALPFRSQIKSQKDYQKGKLPAKPCPESLPGDVFLILFFVPKWEHSGNFHLSKEKGLMLLTPKSFCFTT